MSRVKHINVVKTESFDWDFEISSGSDRATGTVNYTDNRKGWKKRVPMLNSRHPELSALLLKKIKAKGLEGDLVAVTLSYESNDTDASMPGTGDGPRKPNKKYGGEYSDIEEPLLTNKRYAAVLSDAEKMALTEIMNGNIYKDEAGKDLWEKAVISERGKECLAKIRKGTQSVIQQGFIWVEKLTIKSLAELNLDKIGKIDAPPGGAPTPPGRNYRYMAPRFDPNEDGETWAAERRWQLSGPGGWDPQLYGPDE